MALKEAENRENTNFSLEKLTLTYPDVPSTALYKATITQYGVDMPKPLLFNQYPDIGKYKTKFRKLDPRAKDLQVVDTSIDQGIIPAEIIIQCEGDPSIVKLGYRENSPLIIDIEEGNIVVIKDKKTGKSLPVDVSLVERMAYQDARLPVEIDEKQPKMSDFIDVVGQDRLSVMLYDGCWNWNSGIPCRFCDYNPKREGHDSAKPSLNKLRNFGLNISEWWQSTKEKYFEGLQYSFRHLLQTEKLEPHKHLLLMAGNLPDPKQVWNIALETASTLNQVQPIVDFDNYLNICPHPDISYLYKAKELGVKQVQYNLEVIGDDLQAEMCPGKMRYEPFIGKLQEAVQVMGFGNVRSNFVLGLQPTESLLAGISRLADMGVVADYSIFQPKRGTPLAEEQPPTLETIVKFTKELAVIYKSHGFHGIYCNLSSRSSIINECLCTENTKKA